MIENDIETDQFESTSYITMLQTIKAKLFTDGKKPVVFSSFNYIIFCEYTNFTQ